jgi:4-aminobutyrate aminotransferase-like enzyme
MKNAVCVTTWINNLIIAPPLIIRKEDIDTGVDALEESLELADREVGS